MNQRTRHFRTFIAIGLLGITNESAPGAEPPALEIGPDTTVIDGPRLENGLIDYLSVIDSRASEGVTPENNAAIALVLSMNPDWFPPGDTWRDDALRMMGAKADPQHPVFASIQQWPFETDRLRYEAGDEIDRARHGPWTIAEAPFAAEWLRANEPVLDRIAPSLSLSEWYVPFVIPGDTQEKTLMSVRLPHLAHARSIAAAFQCRAMRSLREGRFDDAIEDAMSLKRLALMLAREGSQISYLVGLAINDYATDTVVKIAEHTRLTRGNFRRLTLSLKPVNEAVFAFDGLQGMERFNALDIAQREFRQVVDNSFSSERLVTDDSNSVRLVGRHYDHNMAMRVINEEFDAAASAMQSPSFMAGLVILDAQRDRAVNALGDLNNIPSRLMRAEPSNASRSSFSGMVARTILPPFKPMFERTWIRRADHVLESIALALSAYRAEQGDWPQLLNALVPDMLDTVPLDPFNDEPLHYRVNDDASVTVWSVGPNLTDDNADERDDVVVMLKKPSN